MFQRDDYIGKASGELGPWGGASAARVTVPQMLPSTVAQRLLAGGPQWHYPYRSFTGWNAPVSPDAL